MTRSKSSRSELPFGSLLVYSPQGSSAGSDRSRQVVRNVKNCRRDHITRVGERFAQLFAERRFANQLGAETSLVPVPRRSPTLPDMIWPALEICRELSRRSLCRDVRLLLERHAPVPKSALVSKGSDRPDPDAHRATIRCPDTLEPAPARITIVDDIVTRGSTMLGCAWTLAARFPGVAISALAVVRTMTGAEVTQILEPIDEGRIFLSRGTPRRTP